MNLRYNDVHGYFGYGKLYESIVDEIPDNETIIEIGSYKGRSTSYLMELCLKKQKKINIICIDHFLGSVEHQGEANLYDNFLHNTSNMLYRYPIVVLKGDSNEIHKFIPEKSIYACMIDASHDYVSVKKDICNYLPKIKSGGIICGDDYDWPGVASAVHEILNDVSVVPRSGGDCAVDLYAGNYWSKRV